MDFKLKVYLNPMRDDGVFVAEDRPIKPYPNGYMYRESRYPAMPLDGFFVPFMLPREFAEEIVRRWNAQAPPAQRGENLTDDQIDGIARAVLEAIRSGKSL